MIKSNNNRLRLIQIAEFVKVIKETRGLKRYCKKMNFLWERVVSKTSSSLNWAIRLIIMSLWWRSKKNQDQIFTKTNLLTCRRVTLRRPRICLSIIPISIKEVNTSEYMRRSLPPPQTISINHTRLTATAILPQKAKLRQWTCGARTRPSLEARIKALRATFHQMLEPKKLNLWVTKT